MLEKLLTKIGGPLFLAYMIAGLVPMLKYEMEFNAPFILAFKYLTLPIFIFVFVVYLFLLPNWRRAHANDQIKAVIICLMTASMLLLVSGGYVMGYNIWVGQQSPVTVSGEVTKMRISQSSKSISYLVTIKNKAFTDPVKMDVSEETYSQLELGAEYSEVWYRGSLGLLYKPKQ